MKRKLFLSVPIISLSFLILLLLVSNVNSSSDWVKYIVDKDGNVHSYRKGDIKKDGGNYIVQVWDKTGYSYKSKEKEIQLRKESGLSTEGYDKLSNENILIEIDCKKKRKRILSIIQLNTNGKILHSIDIDKGGWIYIISDSNDENLLKKVCPNK